MFVVTFYSFKGGVGRTLAAVNAGAELAQRGRRVLLVDFDLEAPGLLTFGLFDHGNQNPGLVDYVCRYIATNKAPDVGDYLTRATRRVGNGEMWLMSAGRQDATYAERLQSIDWPQLYSH